MGSLRPVSSISMNALNLQRSLSSNTSASRDLRSGLDPLKHIDRIFIQKVDPTMDFMSPEFPVPVNRIFRIMNISGEQILLAGEEVDYGSRCWRGMQRRYTFYVFSITGEVILSVDRQRLRVCDTCPCPSSLEEGSSNEFSDAEVLALHDTEVMHFPTGNLFGVLKDCSSVCMPQYQIEDDHGINILNIRGGSGGTCCPGLSPRNSNLKLYDSHRNYLGQLQKTVTLEDLKGKKNYCMAANFPTNMSVVMKALVLAAMLELNITYFERCLATTDFIWALLIILLLAMSSLLLVFVTLFAIS